MLTTASSTGISGSAISSGTVPEAYGGTGTSTGYYSFKNRIINGAMVIDQRNAGASSLSTNTTYYLDRWVFFSSQNNKFNIGQNLGSVTSPTGFKNYLGLNVASSVAVGSGDYFSLAEKIEGFNVADLDWGTANAKTVTLSFLVYSSLTGTFGAVFRNSSSNRSYPFTYTISSANTWTTISVTVAGDTTGTWNSNSSSGIEIWWSLGAGSTFSGTAGAWSASNLTSATGAVSVVGTNGATFYITGVQLEKGSTATSFDYRPYGTELALCQRYFQMLGKGLNGSPGFTIFGLLTYESASTAWGPVPLKVTMRTQPTATYSGTFSTSYGTAGTGTNDTNQTGPDNAVIGWSTGSGGTAGYSTYYRASNSTATFISFSAEL